MAALWALDVSLMGKLRVNECACCGSVERDGMIINSLISFLVFGSEAVSMRIWTAQEE